MGTLPPCSISLVLDRSISLVCQLQFGCGDVCLTLRCFAVECPLQFAFGVQLVRALKSLAEHGDLRRAIPAELHRYFHSAFHLPLANDQALRTRSAGRYEHSHAGYYHDSQLRIHVVLQEASSFISREKQIERRFAPSD